MLEKNKKSDSKLNESTLEELERIKLIEEINELRKPYWRKDTLLSIMVTLLLGIIAAGFSVWEIQGLKINILEEEKNNLAQKTEELVKREKLVSIQFQEALAEKSQALTDKASAISENVSIDQKIKNWELSKREYELEKSIERLEILNDELERISESYKKGFVDSFVDNNIIVNSDIDRFSTEQNKDEFKKWLKEKFLWTALTRYEQYILREVENASQ